MNKKTNSVIFMVVATLVNVLLLVLYFALGIVLMVLFAQFFPESGLLPILMLLVFILAIALSFLTYSKLVKWAVAKFSLEEKMDPIFSSRRNKNRSRMD